MKTRKSNKFSFFLDPELLGLGRGHVIFEYLNREKQKIHSNIEELSEKNINIIFTEFKKVKKNYWPKNKILICDGPFEVASGPILYCDFMSFKDVESLILKIEEADRKSTIINILKKSEKKIIDVFDQNTRQHNLITKDSEKDFLAIVDLELQLLKIENIIEWNNSFKLFVKKNNWIQNFEIISSTHLSDADISLEDESLLLKLPLEKYFLWIKYRPQLNSNVLCLLEYLVNMVIKCIQLNDLNLIRTDDEIDFWKRIFAKIPYPMAVITKLSDLLIYNELFAKIGILPKECLAFKVKKIEINLNNQMVYYFIFYSTEKIKHNNKDHKGKIDELGIVSSSIAHELNNPLAGILAAISLISLEDFWSDESLLEIEDMKNGAKRCKELVEIFLGFSRFSPSDKFHTSLKASLDQAINLLRFRMVESNLRIEMKYTPSLESFMPKFNSSILSMIMYLIMSELLTAFAHHRLVTQHNLNSMIGEVIEFSNQIVFRLDDDFEYEEKLAQSKLLQHLLMFEKLEISFSKGMIRIQAHG
jgi:signal transduction histidine kinase